MPTSPVPEKPGASARRAPVRKSTAAASRTGPAHAAKAGKAPTGAKRARPPKAPKVAPPAERKATKQKLVRDSFTMPRADYELIEQMKTRAIAFGRPAKKSELLRAGLQALVALDDATLKARLEALVMLKPGRPKKGH